VRQWTLTTASPGLCSACARIAGGRRKPGYDDTSLSFTARRADSKRQMGTQWSLQDDEGYCRVHGETSGPVSDDVPCPLAHAAERCPVCSLGWVGPGPGDSVVLCILTRHIVETHPNTAHATTLRFNAEQLGGSASPDHWCQHDPEQHRRIMVLEPTF
jgi:hypothetical protein